MKKKAVANQKLMHDISHENQRLKEPLTNAVAKVAELRAQLKDQEKDRLSLRNAKARLHILRKQLSELRVTHSGDTAGFAAVEKERDELYESFESSVRAAQQKSDFANHVLEQRLVGMNESVENTSIQIRQLVEAADLNQGDVQYIASALDDAMRAQNQRIRDLEYDVVKSTKVYNDTLRTYSAKLNQLGVVDAEIAELGFKPLESIASVGPAGLVVR